MIGDELWISLERNIGVWNIRNQLALVRLINCPGTTLCMAVVGLQVWSSGTDATLRRWSPLTYDLTHKIEKVHNDAINAICYDSFGIKSSYEHGLVISAGMEKAVSAMRV